MREPCVPYECGKQPTMKNAVMKPNKLSIQESSQECVFCLHTKSESIFVFSLFDVIVLIHRDKYACSGSPEIQYKERKEYAHDRKELLKLEVLLQTRQDKKIKDGLNYTGVSE